MGRQQKDEPVAPPFGLLLKMIRKRRTPEEWNAPEFHVSTEPAPQLFVSSSNSDSIGSLVKGLASKVLGTVQDRRSKWKERKANAKEEKPESPRDTKEADAKQLQQDVTLHDARSHDVSRSTKALIEGLEVKVATVKSVLDTIKSERAKIAKVAKAAKVQSDASLPFYDLESHHCYDIVLRMKFDTTIHKTVVNLKGKNGASRTVEHAIAGTEAMRWMVESLNLPTRTMAEGLGQRLVDVGFFRTLKGKTFAEDGIYEMRVGKLRRAELDTLFKTLKVKVPQLKSDDNCISFFGKDIVTYIKDVKKLAQRSEGTDIGTQLIRIGLVETKKKSSKTVMFDSKRIYVPKISNTTNAAVMMRVHSSLSTLYDKKSSPQLSQNIAQVEESLELLEHQKTQLLRIENNETKILTDEIIKKLKNYEKLEQELAESQKDRASLEQALASVSERLLETQMKMADML